MSDFDVSNPNSDTGVSFCHHPNIFLKLMRIGHGMPCPYQPPRDLCLASRVYRPSRISMICGRAIRARSFTSSGFRLPRGCGTVTKG